MQTLSEMLLTLGVDGAASPFLESSTAQSAPSASSLSSSHPFFNVKVSFVYVSSYATFLIVFLSCYFLVTHPLGAVIGSISQTPANRSHLAAHEKFISYKIQLNFVLRLVCSFF